MEDFEDSGKFYLMADRYQKSGGGVFDGTIEEIGWDEKWIVARVKRIYHGDPDGWYAVNVQTHQVRGPLAESELKTNTELSKIIVGKSADVMRNPR